MVGCGHGRNDRRAIIWTEAEGIEKLSAVLKETLGPRKRQEVSRWLLSEAHAVSDDGTSIVGSGRDPE